MSVACQPDKVGLTFRPPPRIVVAWCTRARGVRAAGARVGEGGSGMCLGLHTRADRPSYELANRSVLGSSLAAKASTRLVTQRLRGGREFECVQSPEASASSQWRADPGPMLVGCGRPPTRPEAFLACGCA